MALLVFWASGQREPTYAATASVFVPPVSDSSAALQGSIIPTYALAVYASAVSTDELASRAVSRLLSEYSINSTVDSLLGSLTTSIEPAPNPTTGFIHIEARAESARSAEAMANALAQELVEWQLRRAGSLITESLTNWRERVSTLDERIGAISAAAPDAVAQAEISNLMRARGEAATQQTIAESMRPVPLLEVFTPATDSATRVAPNPTRNAAIAFAAAVLLGYGVFLTRQLEEPR